ncbi:MAG: hypothetical protein H7338_22345 [Candidatus Sericytochromatia bacterium]|nr:hypothetical protein [Candidatus Sericytochromatia bacterium]
MSYDFSLSGDLTGRERYSLPNATIEDMVRPQVASPVLMRWVAETIRHQGDRRLQACRALHKLR